MREYIDLAQPIYEGHPVYHTHQKTVVWTDSSHEDIHAVLEAELGEEPPFTFETRGLLLCDHGPTHVDAPKHYKPDGVPIDEMSLETFYTPGKAIDVSHRSAGEYITVSDLQESCSEYDVTIEPGDTVLIRTGHYDDTYPSHEYVRDYPGLNAEATQWLIDRDVANFGVDQPSPDTPADPTYPCHTLCREHDLPHVENLRNIDKLLGKTFTFIGFPLPIRDGTGSPIRPVAVLNDE